MYSIPNRHLTVANGPGWRYGGVAASPRSSLTILANSFLSNETYQLMVNMVNRQNPNVQVTAYLLVEVRDTPSQLIVIG